MNYIKHWRKNRGLTLQALGDRLDPPASAGTIQSYEAGTRDPSLARLNDIARALHVTAGKLLDGPPRIPTESELASMLETAQRELAVGVSLGDYPTAVASSLRDQLLLFSGVPANGASEGGETKKAPASSARPRSATKRSAAA